MAETTRDEKEYRANDHAGDDKSHYRHRLFRQFCRGGGGPDVEPSNHADHHADASCHNRARQPPGDPIEEVERDERETGAPKAGLKDRGERCGQDESDQ